ncbi:MAG: hypothetical protein LIO71_08505 [Ruminococcus sp.]|nr:hypothetical protein [Ruminococcus sp.]MCD7800337.1 hypothetical protein [Ruminococcus sp.]
MDNLMDKVQELLSDPESLKQIQELADILNSDMNNSNSQQTQPQGEQFNTTNDFNNQQNSNFINSQNNDAQENQNDNSNGFDFGMIFQLMQLFNNTSNSQDATLLLALKPYLSEGRQSKVDKAIKLMKMYDIFTIAKDSGLLNNLDSLI